MGLAYDYCVGSTAHDSVLNGFETFVIIDATKYVAENTAKTMEERLAKVGVKQIRSTEI